MIVIFDLDGTISDHRHRLPLVDGSILPKDWDEYYARCGEDEALPVATLMSVILESNFHGPPAVYLWTGRRESTRTATCAWLHRHFSTWTVPYNELRMRPDDCFLPGHVLKKQWLDSLDAVRRGEIVCAFEDDPRCVSMYRSAGVACMQVADYVVGGA